VAVGGSGAGGGAGTVAKFSCGNGARGGFVAEYRSCASGSEYCAAASANGAALLAECRPYPSGCSTCACAKTDAYATIRNFDGCSSYAVEDLKCEDGLVDVGEADSSATLSVVCMVP
jgi:hypothetical protein